MSIHNYIHNENYKKLEVEINSYFNGLIKKSFGESKITFKVENIKIDKSTRLNCQVLVDERKITEDSELNYAGVTERRNVDENSIDVFSFERKDYSFSKQDKSKLYRVDGSNQTRTCGGCSGRKTITCDGCNGGGNIRCSSCSGRGEKKCSNCYGSGEVNCSMIFGCGGKGYTTSYENGRDIRRTCSSCNGRGKNPCSDCASGYITCSSCTGRGQVTCSSCSGQGIVDCLACDATGSFTDFLNVQSYLRVLGQSSIVSGSKQIEFLVKKLKSEEHNYSKEWTDYKLSDLKDYSNSIKDLIHKHRFDSNQAPKKVNFSIEELASLSFQIIIGNAVYDGGLKDGGLWINESVIDLLFYDVIDGVKVDNSFSNILSSEKAFKTTFKNIDKQAYEEATNLFAKIRQYNSFEQIVNSNKSLVSKIISVRQKSLINVSKYLDYLHSRFRRRILITSVFIFCLSSAAHILLLQQRTLAYYGYELFIIPLIGIVINMIIASLVYSKDSRPGLLEFLSILIMIVCGGISYSQAIEKEAKMTKIIQVQKKEKIKKEKEIEEIKKRDFEFENFKQNKRLLSRLEFQHILKSSYRYGPWNRYYGDSIIILKASGNSVFSHYIEAGVQFTIDGGGVVADIERVLDYQLELEINHEEFLRKKHYSKIWSNTSQAGINVYVNPKDIKYEEKWHGIITMENTMYDYESNSTKEYLISIEEYVKIYPESSVSKKYKQRLNRTENKPIESVEKTQNKTTEIVDRDPKKVNAIDNTFNTNTEETQKSLQPPSKNIKTTQEALESIRGLVNETNKPETKKQKRCKHKKRVRGHTTKSGRTREVCKKCDKVFIIESQ